MRTIQALVACSDLLGYAKFSNSLSEEQIYHFLTDYYEFVGDAVSKAGGKVIKFMGDATLILFPEDQMDAGVDALLSLQTEGDRFLAERRIPTKHRIRAHFGPVHEAEVGTRSEKRLDILGSTVNKVFQLSGADFALSQEAFDRLAQETRERFRACTPQVVYVPST